LDLSGIVLEAIISQLEGEVESLKAKNQELQQNIGVNEKKKTQKEAEAEKRIKSYEKQLEELKATELTTKNNEMQLLAEKVKLLEEQSNHITTIRQLNQIIEEKEKIIEESAKKYDVVKKELDELQDRKSKARRVNQSSSPRSNAAKTGSTVSPRSNSVKPGATISPRSNRPTSPRFNKSLRRSVQPTQPAPPTLSLSANSPASAPRRVVSQRYMESVESTDLSSPQKSSSQLGRWRMSVSLLPSMIPTSESARDSYEEKPHLRSNSKKRPPTPSLVIGKANTAAIWQSTVPRSSATVTKSVKQEKKPAPTLRRVQTDNLKEKLEDAAKKNRDLADLLSGQGARSQREIRQSLPVGFATRAHSVSLAPPVNKEAAIGKNSSSKGFLKSTKTTPVPVEIPTLTLTPPEKKEGRPKSGTWVAGDTRPRISKSHLPPLEKTSSPPQPPAPALPAPTIPLPATPTTPAFPAPVPVTKHQSSVSAHPGVTILSPITSPTTTPNHNSNVTLTSSIHATGSAGSGSSGSVGSGSAGSSGSVGTTITRTTTHFKKTPRLSTNSIQKPEFVKPGFINRERSGSILLNNVIPEREEPSENAEEDKTRSGEGMVTALRSKFSRFKEFKSDRRARASRGFISLSEGSGINLLSSPEPSKNLAFESLTDLEFVRKFKMTRAQFDTLPIIKAQSLKRQAGYL
jgi:hypothetical protein